MKLTLTQKHSEVGNVMSLRFRPEKPLVWEAGQYLRYELTVDGEPQDHWFTIASAPFEGEIMVTTHIRPSSAFKQALAALQPGDTIKANALGGDFVWRHEAKPLIFIAAGIGITPFYSMLRQRAHDHQPLSATLLYSNASSAIVFEKELAQLVQAHPEFAVIYTTGQPLTSELVQATIPDVTQRLVYMTGPQIVIDELGPALQDIGVEDHNLIRDWFPDYGYDE